MPDETTPGLPGLDLQERIGGTVAAVHRGVLAGSGRVVAVKVLGPQATREARAALRREAELLDRVDHPNVLTVLDVLEPADGTLALVLPWASGGTLAARLARGGPLSAAETCELGSRLAEGLCALHAGGWLHGDVNPTNVLFDAEDVPLLGDLDAALPYGAVPAGGLRATAEYLDPVLHAGGPAVAAADGWALGVTLYETASGRLPYAASTPEATVLAAGRGGHVPLEHLVAACPRQLAATVAGLLAPEAEARPSLADVAVALEGARLAAAPAAAAVPGAAGVLGAPMTGATTTPTPAPAPAPAPVPGPGRPGALAGRDATPPAGPRSGGTRRFGPPPPAPARRADGRRRWWWLLAAALVVLLPVLALSLLRDGGGPIEAARPDAAPTDTTAAPTAVPPATCADDATPAGAGGEAVLLVGDVDGDGCSETLTWEAGVLAHTAGGGEVTRLSLGEATDVPLLGDWDCDGTWTPGVYRPATGQVFLFDGVVAGGGELTSRPAVDTGVVGGTPVVVDPAGDGCHAVEVRPG